MKRVRRVVEASLVLGATALGARAGAEEAVGQVRLQWEAGAATEGCITQAELERLVEVELGREVFARETVAAAVVQVTLEARPEAPGFRAFVRARSAPNGNEGEPATPVRELLSDGDCRALDEQLTLVVALLADSETAAPSEPPAESSEPVEEAPEPEEVPGEVQPLGPVSSAPSWDAAQRAAPWRFELDAAVAGSVGVLPNVAGGGELGGFALPPSLPGLRARAMLLVSESEELADGASVSFLFASAGLALCPPVVTFSSGRVVGCLGADAAFVRAASHRLDEGREATSVVPLVGLTLRGTLKLGASWLATATAGASLPTKFDRFVYRRDGVKEEIFQMAVLPVFLTLGASYELL